MGGRNEGILDWTRESGFCMDCLAEKYPELNLLKGVQ